MKENNPNPKTQTRQEKLNFDRNLKILKEFINKHNHFPGPLDNALLFKWTNMIRERYKRDILGRTHITQLNAISFTWTIKDSDWSRKAETVKQLLLEGKIPTAKTHALYGWLRNSLDQLRHDLLPADKKHIMQEIQTIIQNMQLPVPSKAMLRDHVAKIKWEEKYNQLVLFRQIHTKCWPRNNSGDQKEKELYHWCQKMRIAYRNNELNHDCITKLNSINFNFH